jgi:hypothetical protein
LLSRAICTALDTCIGSGGFEIERQIVQNVLALLTLPRRREIAEARFRQAQVRAIDDRRLQSDSDTRGHSRLGRAWRWQTDRLVR